MRWAKGASGIYRGAQAYVWVDAGPGRSGRSADDQTHRGTFLSSLMPKMAGFIDKNSQPEQQDGGRLRVTYEAKRFQARADEASP